MCRYAQRIHWASVVARAAILLLFIKNLRPFKMSVGMRLPEAQKNSTPKQKNLFQTFFFLSIFSLLLSFPLKYVGSMQTQSLTKEGTQRLQAPPPSFCCDTVLPVKLVHTFLCSFNSPLILCLCRMCEIQWCLMVRKQHC